MARDLCYSKRETNGPFLIFTQTSQTPLIMQIRLCFNLHNFWCIVCRRWRCGGDTAVVAPFLWFLFLITATIIIFILLSSFFLLLLLFLISVDLSLWSGKLNKKNRLIMVDTVAVVVINVVSSLSKALN